MRTGGALRFFLPNAATRLGVAMSGLAVLWAVHGATGSYVSAGTATGVFAVADAVVGPQVARAVDRRGQARVVSVTATVFVAAMAALLVLCTTHAPGWSLPAPAALAGASVPPAGALSAARWRHLLAGSPRMTTALSRWRPWSTTWRSWSVRCW